MAVFQQAWTYLRDNFFDPKMQRRRLERACASAYAPLSRRRRARRDEMRRLLNLMVGELNASHLGVNAPPARRAGRRQGSACASIARSTSATGAQVTEVIAAGAGRDRGEIARATYLLSVDGAALRTRARISMQLLDHTDQAAASTLTVAPTPTGRARGGGGAAGQPGDREEPALPRSGSSANRAYVAKASNGRLGYVHMFDMSDAALTQLYVDLDAENQARDGVVIDVRNNNGGFVNAYALDVFARRGYLTMTPRGEPPRRRERARPARAGACRPCS